ncbi:MAG: AAA family ATPase [Candidatus Carbobacillus altaicus]|nr:AAA family ATPase [Candidatus Carbobacillus altaicus]
MSDQAERLRRLMQQNTTDSVPLPLREGKKSDVRARVLGWASGKGGVGKSNLVLSLAYALSDGGGRVLLVDADAGFTNLALLMGEGSAPDLMDVIEGRISLTEALVRTPGGFYYTSLATTLETYVATENHAKTVQLESVLRQLEAWGEIILLDFGAGLSALARHMLAAVDELVLVITPEITSLSDAYALYKWLYRIRPELPVYVLINRAQDEKEAEQMYTRFSRIALSHVGGAPKYLGFVREDPHIPQAVRRQMPFYTAYPRSPASRDIRHIRARLSLAWEMYEAQGGADAARGGMRGLLERLKELVRRGEGWL